MQFGKSFLRYCSLTATSHCLKRNICPILMAKSFDIALDSTNVVCRRVGVSWEYSVYLTHELNKML